MVPSDCRGAMHRARSTDARTFLATAVIAPAVAGCPHRRGNRHHPRASPWPDPWRTRHETRFSSGSAPRSSRGFFGISSAFIRHLFDCGTPRTYEVKRPNPGFFAPPPTLSARNRAESVRTTAAARRGMPRRRERRAPPGTTTPLGDGQGRPSSPRLEERAAAVGGRERPPFTSHTAGSLPGFPPGSRSATRSASPPSPPSAVARGRIRGTSSSPRS